MRGMRRRKKGREKNGAEGGGWRNGAEGEREREIETDVARGERRTAETAGVEHGREEREPAGGWRRGSVGSCVAGCCGSGATVLLRPPAVDFRGSRAA